MALLDCVSMRPALGKPHTLKGTWANRRWHFLALGVLFSMENRRSRVGDRSRTCLRHGMCLLTVCSGTVQFSPTVKQPPVASGIFSFHRRPRTAERQPSIIRLLPQPPTPTRKGSVAPHLGCAASGAQRLGDMFWPGPGPGRRVARQTLPLVAECSSRSRLRSSGTQWDGEGTQLFAMLREGHRERRRDR